MPIFTDVVRETVRYATEYEWCDEFEDKAIELGIASEDYQRARIRQWRIHMTVEYELMPEALDRILREEFGGSHDVSDVVSVESQVVVDYEGVSADDDINADGLLRQVGYDRYTNVTVDDWEEA